MKNRNKSATLESIKRVLEEAVLRGELTATEARWSIERISNGVRQPVARTDGANRRDDVVRAAIDVFRRVGYHRATMDDIAEEVGLTRATVYHYFTSKQDILGVICEIAMTSGETALNEGLSLDAAPEERVREALFRYAWALIQQPALPVLMRNYDELKTDAMSRFERRRRQMVRTLSGIIDEGVRTGVFAVEDARIATLTAFGSINWLYSWYDPAGRHSADDVCKVLVTQVMNGLRSSER